MAWLGLALAAGSAVAIARRFTATVAVEGDSMAPALLPGDWLVMESLTYRVRGPRPGDVVVAGDPRNPGREVIKRVVVHEAGAVELLGDAPHRSTDSRTFGRVKASSIRWRAWLRYRPIRRMGVVR